MDGSYRGLKTGMAAACLLLLGVAARPDCLTTEQGEKLEGRVGRYDEYSYIVILKDGGRVILPERAVKKVERDVPGSPRYKKRKDLIAVSEVEEDAESGQRILEARLTDVPAEVKPYGLETEAQALLYVLDSEERYADAYRVSYKQGWLTTELEYQWAKDLLLRRVKQPGGQAMMRILGASGTGLEALAEAAQGRLEIKSGGFISSLGKPMPAMPKERRYNRSSGDQEPRRTTPW